MAQLQKLLLAEEGVDLRSVSTLMCPSREVELPDGRVVSRNTVVIFHSRGHTVLQCHSAEQAQQLRDEIAEAVIALSARESAPG